MSGSGGGPDREGTRTGYGEAEERAGRRRAPGGPRCELCGATMLDRHCKLVCLNCGYQRDCSDP